MANRPMTTIEWGLLIALSALWGGSFLFNGILVRELPPLTIVHHSVELSESEARGYALLRSMAPMILDAQARGAIAAASLHAEHPTQDVALGDYTLNVDLRRNRRDPKQVPALGYALAIQAGPDEFYVAGCDVQVVFFSRREPDAIVGFASTEAGQFVDGQWKPGRRMNGDDILLRYDIAKAAAQNQSGSGLRFFGPNPSVQHVELYRYR